MRRHQPLPDGALDVGPGGALESLRHFNVGPVKPRVGDLVLGLRVGSHPVFGRRHHLGQRALVILKLHHVELLPVSQLLVGFLQHESIMEVRLFERCWLKVPLATCPHLIGQPSEESPGDIEKIDRSLYFAVHVLYADQLAQSDDSSVAVQTVTCTHANTWRP